MVSGTNLISVLRLFSTNFINNGFRRDATLQELALLLKEIQAQATRPHARISFRLVYMDNLRGRYTSKDIGVVMNSRSTTDDKKTLDDVRFVIGDYIDICIMYGSSGSVGRGVGEGVGGRFGRGGYDERRGNWDRDGPRNGGGVSGGVGSVGGGRIKDDRPSGREGGDKEFGDRDKDYRRVR